MVKNYPSKDYTTTIRIHEKLAEWLEGKREESDKNYRNITQVILDQLEKTPEEIGIRQKHYYNERLTDE